MCANGVLISKSSHFKVFGFHHLSCTVFFLNRECLRMCFSFIQKRQLLQLGVPSSFIAFCLNEGTRNPVHSPNIDYTKLYAVVSILIRCFDLSVKQQSSVKVDY